MNIITGPHTVGSSQYYKEIVSSFFVLIMVVETLSENFSLEFVLK